MPDFFVSYTQADRAWAEWIAWTLEEEGYSTRIQAWDFRPSQNFVVEMQKAAEAADRTLVVLSPAYLRSRFGAAEWTAAFARDPTGEQGKLLPVKVGACEPPALLASRVGIDIAGLTADEARARLLAGVKSDRAKPLSQPGFPGGRSAADREGTPPPFPNAASRPRRPARRLAVLVAAAGLLSAGAAGWLSFRSAAPPAGTAEVARTQTLRGEILDEETGKPLAGVAAALPQYGLATVTGADGQFRFAVPAAAGQNVRLRAMKEGYGVITADPSIGSEFLNTYHMARENR